MYKASRIAGFTLIELMVALAVLAILLTVGVPSFQSLFERNRAKTTAESVRGFFDEARAEALRRNLPLRVTVSAGENWCLGLSLAECDCAEANSCVIDGRERVLSAQSFRAYPLQSSFAAGNTVFEPRRGTASASGLVTVQAPNGSVSINLNRLGRTSTCSTAGYGYPSC